jgi:hypothetical protein
VFQCVLDLDPKCSSGRHGRTSIFAFYSLCACVDVLRVKAFVPKSLSYIFSMRYWRLGLVSQSQVCANTEVQLPFARQPPQLWKVGTPPVGMLQHSACEPAIWRKTSLHSGYIGVCRYRSCSAN